MTVYQKMFFIIPPVLGVLGIPTLIVGMIKFPVLNNIALIFISILLCLPIGGIFVGIAAIVLRGLNRYGQLVAIVAILTFILFSWASPGVAFLLNGLLDKSNPSVHTALVIKKFYSSSSKGMGKTYFVRLESWKESKKSILVEVNSSIYADTTPNETRITLITKKGGLGFERLLEQHIEPY